MNRVSTRSSSRSRSAIHLTVKNFPEAALKVMRKRIKELEPTRGKLSYAQYLAEIVFKDAEAAAQDGGDIAAVSVKSGEKKRPNGGDILIASAPAPA